MAVLTSQEHITNRDPGWSTRPVLEVRNLFVRYQTNGGQLEAVRNVSLHIGRGETFGLVGESGCGKSSLAFAVMGYLGPSGSISGEILLNGESLQDKTESELQPLRGSRMSMVYQDPLTSLNPSITVGEQIAEVYRVHLQASYSAAWQRAVEMLGKVGLPDPNAVARHYPHQLSGGMQQRVVIAMALCCDPDLLVMDEPTTALDVTTEARVLDLINELKHEFDSATLYISHNLGVISQVCDRVAVMYASQVVEDGTVDQIFSRPLHPYTIGLLGCIPTIGLSKATSRLKPIEGSLARAIQETRGCNFAPRCEYAQDICHSANPRLSIVEREHRSRCHLVGEVEARHRDRAGKPVPRANRATMPDDARYGTLSAREGYPKSPEEGAQLDDCSPLLEVLAVKKRFGAAEGLGGLLRRLLRRPEQVVRAVDGVSFSVAAGQTLALVGESGCGKTTLGRIIAGLEEPSDGCVRFQDSDLGLRAEQRPSALRRQIQMVFQNPESSLNPRQTVANALERPLWLFRGLRGRKAREEAIRLLEEVNIDPSYIDRYPKQLSGGEKQRVAIARAFAGEPQMVICDEPVSALDVSVQATVLNLLVDLQEGLGTSYLFISHDLSVVRYIADWIGVIYLGQICELGPAEDLFRGPQHPYSEALLSAVPSVDPRLRRSRIRLDGAVPSAMNPPSGCRFHTRCPRRVGKICEETPPPTQRDGEHEILCHIPFDELRRLQSTSDNDPVASR